MYLLFCQLSGLFLNQFWISKDFLRKVIKRRENNKGFYPPVFRNSLESWQKSEYPLCKIIASQKNVPGLRFRNEPLKKGHLQINLGKRGKPD